MSWLPQWLRRETWATRQPRNRSIALLRRNLSPDQDALYRSRGHIVVAGGETGQKYRIRNALQMNVDVLDRHGRPTSTLCFGPRGGLPIGDSMLAQKLALELFERDALAVANWSPYSWTP